MIRRRTMIPLVLLTGDGNVTHRLALSTGLLYPHVMHVVILAEAEPGQEGTQQPVVRIGTSY